jgi:hypothetical protein
VVTTKFKTSFIFFLFLIISNSDKLFAQQWLGISGSNYAGTNAVYNNPANLSDSRYKLYVNLVANDIFISNNYVGWNAPYSILQLLTNTAAQEYRNSRNIIVFKNTYYDINENSDSYHANILDDLRGPSFLYTINQKSAIGLLTRIKTATNFSGASLGLANLIRLGTDTLLLKNQNFKLAESTINVNSYAELGLSYSRILQDDDEDFVKVGITLKRVVGIYNAHINIEEADYSIIDDPSDPKKQIFRINHLKANYGHTLQGAYSNASPSLAWGFGNQSAGSGWGIDLGIVYEYRPDTRKSSYREKGIRKWDKSKNKYEYKIGVSILDIGGINYNNQSYVRDWNVDINNTDFNSNDVSKVKDLDDAFSRINQKIGSTDANSVKNFTAGLPTAFQVNFDYHLKDKFYVNSLWVQGLRGVKSIGMKMPSSLSVTPRWESKWIEVAMPFALLDNYSVLSFGLAGRFGPVFLGTDNLGSFLNISRPRGTDFYFGLSVPIFSKPPTLPSACFYEKEESRNWKFWKKRKY